MANSRFFIDYILHYLSANTRHGTHSPFVYKLVDEVIYDFKERPYYRQIEDERKRLKKDNQVITVTDLGAGSMMNKGKQKAIKTLANHALKPKRIAQLLGRLVQHFQPKNLLELGTCLGVTTAYLSKASPATQITTIEGCPETAHIAQSTFKNLKIENVSLRVGNFDDLLPEVIERMDQLDFLFVDGNHRQDATIRYFNACLPKTHDHTVLIFDDIYWSEGMKEAWKTIQEHPEVSVTIDLFFIGLVFFKRNQVKEHFKIRF